MYTLWYRSVAWPRHWHPLCCDDRPQRLLALGRRLRARMPILIKVALSLPTRQPRERARTG